MSPLKFFNTAVILSCMPLGLSPTLAHEVEVHERISQSACLASSGLREFFDQIRPSSGSFRLTFTGATKGPVGWFVEGSAREDDIGKDIGGKRVNNHFYDPLSRRGLNDVPLIGDTAPFLSPVFGISDLGQNSLYWAAVRGVKGIHVPVANPAPTRNAWTWQDARDFQHSGLTAGSKTDREQNLAKMFRALGQVAHLLQDLSQPQHVRNEQHWPVTGDRSPMEKYGAEHLNELNWTPVVLDWKAAGFEKLADFWDRKLLYPTLQFIGAQPLIDNEDPSKPDKKLGLAEFCNGNFVANRHLYGELRSGEHRPGEFGYYPFPSLNGGTDWAMVVQNPGNHGKLSGYFEDGTAIWRVNISKTGAQGIPVTHHASLLYVAAKHHSEVAEGVGAWGDPDVMKEYHDILIPKAIAYSAGLLDYFFRGKLDVALSLSSTPGKLKITIVNKSGRPLKNGTLRLFFDDAAGLRQEVPGFTTTYGTSLPDNATTTGEFTPAGGAVAYMLVFKGSIAVSATTDPIDFDIAIAAERFTRDAFIDVVGLATVHDLASDGTCIGFIAGTPQRPGYYSGLTRTTQDTRTTRDSSPITGSQNANTVNSSAGFFSPADMGKILSFSSGQTATITAYISPTQVTVTPSQSVPSATFVLRGNTLGGGQGIGYVCNANGILAGREMTLANESHAFWLNTVTGEIRDLGVQNVDDISDDGWLILHPSSPSVPTRAFLYNPVLQTFTDLGLLDPTGTSTPIGMNASHVVALNCRVNSPVTLTKAARWTGGALVSIHPAAAGDQYSACLGINASGHILGQFTDPITEEKIRAFLDIAGTTTLIGNAAVHTYAQWINDSDVVVGEVESGSTFLPFIWKPTTGLQTIPLLPGTSQGIGLAVNNLGDVVGFMDGQAFLYRGGTTYRLLDLIAGIPGATGWTSLLEAWFINDNSDIVGVGVHLGQVKRYRLHLPP
jgi:hypothetical protein